jgi:hypothetical protein
MSAVAALVLRGKLEAVEAWGRLRAGALRSKCHLPVTWVDDIVGNRRVLDAVESRPDILVWGTSFYHAGFVSWHQGLTYWGRPADIVTRVDRTERKPQEKGAMRVMPGMHMMEVVPYKDTFAPDNLASRGQVIVVEVDEAEAVALEPGEMSLHHVKLTDGSERYNSATRRIGLAVRYIPTHVRQTAGMIDSAMLVRGCGRFGHIEAEQRPLADLSDAAIAHHAQATGASSRILMRGTERM